MTVSPLPGDFGIVTHQHGPWTNRLAEWAISWGTQSPATHALIYAGNGQIVEAVRHVRVSPAATYRQLTWSAGHLPPHLVPSDQQRREIVTAARSYVGQSYNLLDLAAIALAQRRLGREIDSDDWIARRLDNDGMKICSQLVSAAYTAAGIELCPGKLAALVSPGDLYNLLLFA